MARESSSSSAGPLQRLACRPDGQRPAEGGADADAAGRDLRRQDRRGAACRVCRGNRRGAGMEAGAGAGADSRYPTEGDPRAAGGESWLKRRRPRWPRRLLRWSRPSPGRALRLPGPILAAAGCRLRRHIRPNSLLRLSLLRLLNSTFPGNSL